MKILITGGAGFIGSAIAKALMDRGDKVVLMDNFNDYYDPKLKRDRIKKFLVGYDFKLYKSDIRYYKKLERIFKKESPEKVIHLAAMAGVRYSLENPLLYGEVNFMGTLNLLELSRIYGIKNFIYASSSSVYGVNKKIPFSETDNVDNPISPYAATKKSTELLAHVYSYTHKMKTTGLRFFTVYGPWGRPDMAYFKFANNLFAGKPIEIYNKGKMLRDFTYIDDIVEGMLKVLDADFDCEVMNIGAEKPEKLMDYIEVIEDKFGRKFKKKMLPMQPGDVPQTVADVSKLRKLGWQPTTKIEKGIEKFVDWYQEYYKVRK
ncbi:MAG: NAD-dependent epimerase/dehydratase family protein [Candidatus Moranbacteria bacterium GW2011_GWE2_35_2-]|nr:MAG: NAD-dependent epimerase/dehydratase family protein [Candidatus Moranbacteria bacterium GW2011_GWE2_35_2-]KKQ06810.1 MAG: NAD-dependent epimerase/dehydratase family protein [Candidatus Moranbacteria bacterium GW2011_GWF1_36_4]KKQ22876.1 MAG: NAD-dependent epimerase/dehydratase family protein [Candidatus Moranbacteria bacterium GW2011_GWF2_37_11]KKQ29234.1 MAG: NAD-dependent epimerase/dehydratase family protein [Candidatus Moranbacteria bacterium GW2011_GWD1_37_17]KKQ30893.1 MAG: NAD-depe